MCVGKPSHKVWSIKLKLQWKADTMKTYIVRDPNSVEPQKAEFLDTPEPSPTPTLTSLADIPSQGSQPRALFVGLDVHTGSIAVSLAPSDSTEVRRYGLIGGSHDDVLKLAKKLSAAHLQAGPVLL